MTNGQAVGKKPITSEVLNALAISPITSVQVKKAWQRKSSTVDFKGLGFFLVTYLCVVTY